MNSIIHKLISRNFCRKNPCEHFSHKERFHQNEFLVKSGPQENSSISTLWKGTQMFANKKDDISQSKIFGQIPKKGACFDMLHIRDEVSIINF